MPHVICENRRMHTDDCQCGTSGLVILRAGPNLYQAIDTKPEAVNHPSHYGGDTPYEAIKVIKAWGLGFSLGNAVKYIARAGKKPGVDAREDLRKAIWYLQHELTELERG